MKVDVFISYAREDRPVAQKIAEILESMGWTVWWDRMASAGHNFEDEIEAKLEEAACVIVLWSDHSVKSNWVRAEAGEGLERNKLVPVLIEDVKPPLLFRVIHNASLVNWQQSADEAAFQTVLTHIKALSDPTNLKTHKKLFSRPYPSTYKDSFGIEYILIKPGTFNMGSDEGRNNEKPLHQIEITRAFYIGKYPLTQGQWEAIMGYNDSFMKYGNNHPIENISWEETQRCVTALNQQHEMYRLPTEAEWEYACRAGTNTTYFFGDDETLLDAVAVYTKGHRAKENPAENLRDRHEPVGSRQPNNWGLYDMLGNVWEWVQDSYVDSYDTIVDQNDSQTHAQWTKKVMRGGSWFRNADRVTCASRTGEYPHYRNVDLGMRLVIQPEP